MKRHACARCGAVRRRNPNSGLGHSARCTRRTCRRAAICCVARCEQDEDVGWRALLFGRLNPRGPKSVGPAWLRVHPLLNDGPSRGLQRATDARDGRLVLLSEARTRGPMRLPSRVTGSCCSAMAAPRAPGVRLFCQETLLRRRSRPADEASPVSCGRAPCAPCAQQSLAGPAAMMTCGPCAARAAPDRSVDRTFIRPIAERAWKPSPAHGGGPYS